MDGTSPQNQILQEDISGPLYLRLRAVRARAARRRCGPGGCGWALWPVAITRARSDPALSLTRLCAAPSRATRGAMGGGGGGSTPGLNPPGPQPTNQPRTNPQARAARARRAHRARAGRPHCPLQHSGIPWRPQGASALVFWLNHTPSRNLRHLRAALRRGLERAAAGPPGSRTVRQRSPSAPSIRTWPLSASRRRRPGARAPHRMPTPRRTQRRTSRPRCARTLVIGVQHGCGWLSRCRTEPSVHLPVL